MMEIVEIYRPSLFAIRYDGDRLNIYRLVYQDLVDEKYLSKFFDTFGHRISEYLVNAYGYPRSETEEYIAEVNDRMIDIDEEIHQICLEILEGKRADFGTMFVPHSSQDIRNVPDGGGRSQRYGINYLPVKCWGSDKPSLVRIYAIELTKECYIIIYGGIKIDLNTTDSPVFDKNGNISSLEIEIEKRVRIVSRFLAENGIIDKEGLIQYLEEDHEN